MGLAIVAIPEEQDRVWKISSEKVPHLTLLFLGEAENADLEQIMQFVDHAVTLSEHGQFYLDVDRRGTLGDAEADVLFFSKRSWNLKWIKQFRAQLLQNQAIRTAYDSAEQFTAPQDWVPHLTLGYPETPAKPQEGDNDYPLYSVCFDRIAVWAGDYEGPEFRLEWPERELSEYHGELAVAWADEQKRALVHYGTKGMRWGQRKTETVSVGGKTKQVTPKKAAKLDKKWEENQYKLPMAIERHNAMADHFNSRIGSVNDKYKEDFSKEAHDEPAKWSPRYKEYNKEVGALQLEGFHKAIEKELPSPTGKKKTVLEMRGDTMHVAIKDVGEAKHAADEGDEVFLFKITRNEKGLITNVEPQEDSMSQAVDRGREFVQHASVLDNPTLAEQIKAKIQSILDDVKGDNKDASLFGDPLIQAKIRSVLEDFYKNPNVDNAVVYDALGEVFLEHYGIKGMRWGFRRSNDAVAPTATSKVPAGNRRKTKIKAEGGQNHPAHSDAIRVAEAKVKLKKSGPSALSNSELREVANRVQLENQVKLLTSNKGKRFVGRQLEGEANSLARAGIREGTKRGAKKVGAAALAAA